MTALLVHYRRVSRYGLNALLGAVEEDARTAALPARVAFGLEATVAAARVLLGQGRRPVVAWSFTTASLAEVTAELAAFRAALPGAPVLHVAGGPHPSAEPEGGIL